MTSSKEKIKIYDKFEKKIVKVNKHDYEAIFTNPYMLNRYSKIGDLAK